MSPAEKEEIFYALYAYFNNEALSMDITIRQIYDHIMAKTIRDEAYEFSTIMRDFRNFFEDDF